MAILTNIPDGASNKDIRETLNSVLGRLLALEGRPGTVTPSPTPTPTPPPSFSRGPAIGTDGSPTVGEIVALDFGAIAGDTIGTRQILRADNSVVAEVTTGSYELAAAEQIKLRVYAAATVGLYADTALITVAAAAVSSRSAPALSFPDDRTAGTNPPVVYFASNDDSIDKNTDSFEFKYTSNGALKTGAVPLAEMTQVDDYYYTVPGLDGLSAGDFSIQGRFTGPAGEPSPWSPVLSDTLNAKALPAASTRWDPARRSQHVTVSSDGRNAVYSNEGGNMGIACDTPRADARRADLTFTQLRGAVGVGIMLATRSMPEFDRAAEHGDLGKVVVWRSNGEVNFNGNEFDHRGGVAPTFGEGDLLGIEQQPIMDGTTQTGLRVRFRKNGGAWSAWTDTTMTSAVFVAFSTQDSICRLNTGQDAIEATAPSIRWN